MSISTLKYTCMASRKSEYGLSNLIRYSWWCHQMETFAWLAFCAGTSPVTGEFPAHRPVTETFDVFFDLRVINGCVNNREAGDWIHHRTHYKVFVMSYHYSEITACVLCGLVPNLVKQVSFASIPIFLVRQLFQYMGACQLIKKKNCVNPKILDITAQIGQALNILHSQDEVRQPYMYFKCSEGVFGNSTNSLKVQFYSKSYHVR